MLLILFVLSRQTFVFLDIQRTPIMPVQAQYLQRGSLKYEFSTELLQTPIQLMKINNVQAQVSLCTSLRGQREKKKGFLYHV